jgi:hypothetical protein
MGCPIELTLLHLFGGGTSVLTYKSFLATALLANLATTKKEVAFPATP